MSQYLTSTGFTRPSYDEIRRKIETDIRTAFGAGVNLTAPGPLGQFVATLAKWADDLYALAQEFYTSRDPDTASGIMLDEVCADIGIYRLPATPARASILLWGTYGLGFGVTQFSQVKSSVQPMPYYLESYVDFGNDTFQGLRLTLGTVSTSDVVSVTLDGVAYSHTVLAGQTRSDVADAMVALINAGAFATNGSASKETTAGLTTLRLDGLAFTLTANSAHWTPREEAHDGVVYAGSAGAQALPPYTLDTIASPATGWLSIEQPAAGQDGTDIESDSSLRIRRAQGLRSGTATLSAIHEALFRVSGVSAVSVSENASDVQDGEGRPPHSVEAVVTGGEEAAICQMLGSVVAAGIETYGNTQGTSVDVSGKARDVWFSIPVPRWAWVKVEVLTTDPDGAPAADYEDAIRAAIVAYGNANFAPGANFILGKMYAPIYSVPGIYTVSVQIATSVTPTGSKTYGSGNLEVALREYLSFAPERVEFVP